MSDLSTIPDFVNTTDSMGNSLRAVKQIVDRLAGHTQGASLGAPNMFVQTTEPRTGTNVSLKKGDLWIKPAAGDNPAKMYYWDGSIWKVLG